MDSLIFTLYPFLGGMAYQAFEDFPIDRLYKYLEKIEEKSANLEEVLSLREIEFGRNLSRLFKDNS